ncbi:hypothetical protein [Mucilaginibacter paludis]|uniref:Uncharacterized protein n=1 Tax=Mucilaginibacter paludis DSM 18603 TaxID=714943 RepID=H1YDY7_9SPHI|nr:hypothetical protein [Mucilaginibacter paludis]EHQ24327.1 hypothetical protein Mucpa_0125 [Mucilaginibacter paludis DSM 18603]
MKKIFILITLLSAAASGIKAQNTFPTWGSAGVGTLTPQASFEVTTNTIMGSAGNKFNTALTLIKNGDTYGVDKPVLTLRHSGHGNNAFVNPLTDSGIIKIQGFSTQMANKAINSNENFFVFTNGTVGVNTAYVPSGYNLAINGKAIAASFTVQLKSAWPDYVFKPSYPLMPLSVLKSYIDQNHHLPEVPSAAEVRNDGLNLGEMNKVLIKKVEELTLYLIEKDNEMQQMRNSQAQLEQRLKLLESNKN